MNHLLNIIKFYKSFKNNYLEAITNYLSKSNTIKPIKIIRTNDFIILYFDDLFISSDKGCKKPAIEFYQMLIDKHNLDIKESIMIGNDSTTDIKGATALGMDALYIKTEISPKDDPIPDCKYAFPDGDIGHVLDIIK